MIIGEAIHADGSKSPLKKRPDDVAGRELKVGQEVAFCLGGTGTTMRVGTITDVAAKTVLIAHYDSKYRNIKPELVHTRRAFNAVCICKEVANG